MFEAPLTCKLYVPTWRAGKGKCLIIFENHYQTKTGIFSRSVLLKMPYHQSSHTDVAIVLLVTFAHVLDEFVEIPGRDDRRNGTSASTFSGTLVPRWHSQKESRNTDHRSLCSELSPKRTRIDEYCRRRRWIYARLGQPGEKQTNQSITQSKNQTKQRINQSIESTYNKQFREEKCVSCHHCVLRRQTTHYLITFCATHRTAPLTAENAITDGAFEAKDVLTFLIGTNIGQTVETNGAGVFRSWWISRALRWTTTGSLLTGTRHLWRATTCRSGISSVHYQVNQSIKRSRYTKYCLIPVFCK